MSWGNLWSIEQIQTFEAAVSGRVVLDLGSGDGGMASCAMQRGAKRVIQVEKSAHPQAPARGNMDELERHRIDEADVLLMSWPTTGDPCPWASVLARSPMKPVIYLGANVNGSVCGSFQLWLNLIKQAVTSYVPHPRNSLIVYAAASRPEADELLFDEVAGLTNRFASIIEYPAGSATPPTIPSAALVARAFTGIMGNMPRHLKP